MVPEDVARYAYHQGLYVLAQSGDAVKIRNDGHSLLGSEDNLNLLMHFSMRSWARIARAARRVAILNPYNEREHRADKLSIVDIKARDDQGRALLDHGGIWLLELSKLTVAQVVSEQQRWLKFFTDGERLDAAALQEKDADRQAQEAALQKTAALAEIQRLKALLQVPAAP